MELLPAAYGTTGTGVNTTIASQIIDTGTFRAFSIIRLIQLLTVKCD